MALDPNALPKSERLEAVVLRDLADAVRAHGGEVLEREGWSHGRVDFAFRLDDAKYVVELATTRVNRIRDLEGLLASAWLRSRNVASELGARPLPVLGLEQLSDRTLARLESYARSIAPKADWGIVDRRGRRRFSNALARFDDPGRARPRAERGASAVSDLVSDLGQWMSKVMLASRLPDEMLAAPRERVRNARHLAELANVSAPTAARWVHGMRRERFIEHQDEGLVLVRRYAFLERWRRAVARSTKEIAARFLIPSGAASDHANRLVARYASQAIDGSDPDSPPPYRGALVWKHEPRACLGMFEAANAHGLARVRGAPVHLYLESLSEEALKLFELVPSKRGERVDVVVVRPRFPESTFRGAVMAQRNLVGRVPVTDVLQTWLEVAEHPARGRESAEEIERRVIEPWILKGDDRGRDR